MKIKREALVSRRRSKGLTQQGLAVAMGIAESSIRNLESGRVKRPQPRTLRGLAEVLECDVTDIAVPDNVPEEAGVAS